MSIGLTSSITSNTSYSSQFQMTKDDDILIIRGATVTLLAPQGEIYTNAGDDDVLIDGSTITANESNLKFYLGSGNDLLTLKNCTISVDVSLYNGDDKVIVDGIPENQVNLNNSLLFGNGNDVLELVSTLKNEGAIEFGTTGSKTLKFNGGTLLGNGTATGLTNIDVSLSGGFLGTNLSLSEEQTGISFNGNIFGITGEEEISIIGGNTVLAVENNAQTNIHFVLSGANVLQNPNATLAFLNYTGYAVTADNSEAELHNITTQAGGAFWGCNSNLTLSNCDVSVSNEQTPFIVEEESTVTGEQLSFSSNQGKGAVLIDNSSVNVSEFNAYNNKKIDIVSASCTASAYAPVFAYRRNDTVLKSASNNCAAYSYAHGGSIYQSGGNTTLTNACFSGNSALASSYLRPIAIAKIAASATGYTTKDALCNTVIHYATAIAIASATARAFGNAEAFGGAIFQTGGTLSLNNASFANNEAYTQVTLAGSGSRIITTACYIGYASTYATAQVYHHADAQACGGAIYLCDGEANLTDVSFSGNKASSDYNEKTLGGAIFLTNSVLNYKINAGKTISNINNVAKKGGWLYADNNSVVAFDIESNSLLEIGDADKFADQTSYDDSIAGTTDSLITKNGLGTLCINSDISEYAGKWIINDGIIHLRRTFQTITFDDWSIGTNGTLILSEEQDIVDMGISKEIGTIDFGSGTDILNINEYDLTKGKILVETITISGSGRIGATISNRNITKGNDVTFNGIILDSDYWGNQYDDKLTINEETTFNGQMGLGGGNNAVHVKGTLVSTKGFKIERGGVTNIYAYYGSTIADNMLTVYDDEEAARNTITLDWSEQSDLNKVRILISSDWTFDTFEFNIEFYNQNKSFTLNLQQDYFVQFQSQNEDGEWEHCLLPDSVNPDQVTGVSFDGKKLSWDATHDNIGGNGVKRYHVDVSEDSTFATLVHSEVVEGTELTFASLPEATLYFRVSAEDFTNNFGIWSETVSGLFDITPPSSPSNGYTTVNGYSATLSWTASTDNGSGVFDYEYRVSTDSVFDHVVANGTSKSSTITVDGLRYGTYYWQARATDLSGNVSEWSQSVGFATIDSIAPETPINLNFGIENEVSLFVTWDPVSDDSLGSGLKEYEIQLASDSVFSTIVKNVSVSTTEVFFENLSNATYYLRVCAVDNAENKSEWTETKSFIIDKDTTPPTVTNIQADITAPTKGNVTVTATFSDNKAVASSLYRIGSDTIWRNYTGGVTVSENTIVYFKAIDTTGNESAEASYTVSNIDRTPPEKPIAAADITSPTNGTVSVTATFSEDSSIKEYSLDAQIWNAYTSPVILDKNGSVFFRGTDEAGNVSGIETYTVSNIDTTAPEKPTATANITGPTNQTVTITAIFSGDSNKKEYSLDKQIWMDYADGVMMSENGTVYFRSTDAAGNTSEITSYEVSNIDTIAPEKPSVTADVTEITNGDVQVTATFSDDSVSKQYSLDGTTWRAYAAPIRFSQNGVVYFRSSDAAGNISEQASYSVSNIDRTPPEKPIAAADITTPTNGTVSVAATFSEDSSIKEYSLNEQTWIVYSAPVVLDKNGFVFFRGTDAAGNISEVTTCEVSNIDKIAPNKPSASMDITVPTNGDVLVSAVFSEDSAKKEYSLDGQTWKSYTDAVKFTENGTAYFRGIDEAGNISEVTSFTVGNIDKVIPNKPSASADITIPTNSDVLVSAVFSEDSVKKEYSLDGQTWKTYTSSVRFSENGIVSFRGIDAAGNISEVESYIVSNIDKVAPDKPVATADITVPTNTEVKVSAIFNAKSVTKEYNLNGTGWQDYTEAIIFQSNGTVSFRSWDIAGNVSEVTTFIVSNIDKVAPDKPIASADITSITNTDVTISAIFSGDSLVKEYSLNGTEWLAYTDSIKFTDNGTAYFRGIDEAGNISEVASYAVTNIDKVAPDKPTAVADVTSATNGDVLVTATFSNDSAKKEYSLDGQTWKSYTDAVKFTENGTVYFRGTDEAGNISEVTSYAVTNIDKVAPVKPTAMADITNVTNADVLVSAVFSADSVTKEYSLDGQTWETYTDAVKFTSNGFAFFRSADKVGNMSEVTTFEVSNIDKIAPVKPTATADITTPTNGDVMVTAMFSADSLKKEYSLDGQIWKPYTDSIKVTDNGTVYFRASDEAGNISEVESYTVGNIDRIAPVKPTATANITTATNQDVTVTAVFSEDSVKKEYSLDGTTWKTYSEGIKFTANGNVSFRGTDAAGNISEIATYKVDNIDKTSPEKPIASADITMATNTDVQVSAVFSADSVKKEYKLNESEWLAYVAPINFTENGTVSFRSIDEAGNVSEVTTYEVTNIDKVAPVKPTAVADVTTATNGIVLVTATFSNDSAKKEYSLDGQTWKSYTDAVKFTENGTVYFRGTDEASNLSEVASYAVTNIDKVAPDKPIATADITTLTNTDVLVSATFSEDSVKKEYSLDGTTWRVYSEPIRFMVNGTIHFRGSDAAGNVSEVVSYTVSNIDKVAPDKPIAMADITTPTNTSVHVSAIFNEKSVVKEYSLNGTDWMTYTESIELTDNGMIYFRSKDAVGNVSDVSTYEVTNIDKVAPEKPTASADVTTDTNGIVLVTATFSNDSAKKEYSLDGQTWKSYADAVKFTENGTVYFRGTDEAGNISEIASYAVTNIDKVAPVKPTAMADITNVTNGDVLVSAVFSADSMTKEYSLDGQTWKSYTDVVKFTENGTVYFRGVDEAGNVSEVASYAVANIDKVAPEAPTVSADMTASTNSNVMVTAIFSADSAEKEFSLDNGQTWLVYTEAIKFTENGTVLFRSKDEAGNISEVTSYTVNNIDKIAPEKPVAVANITTPTNGDVLVTATFSEDSHEKEYSLDGLTWKTYSDPITFTENGMVSFRCIDVAGNISEVASYAVNNIDKVAPEKPVATADVTSVTNGDVTVTASFSEDSMTREYSSDGMNWLVYVDGVKFTNNGVVFFRGIDAAGNISEIVSYTVSNIDKVAPDKPTAVADVTSATNGNVLVTATFSNDSAKKEYSLDGQTWKSYTDAVKFTENGTVYFRGTDEAGNVSEIASYAVSNIDKVAPDKPVATADITTVTNTDVFVSATFSADSIEKEYSLDGQTWKSYTDAVKFTANGTVYFRGIDVAGNVSEVVPYTVDNIDKVAPDKPIATADITTLTNTDVLVSATFSEDSVKKEYSLDGTTWRVYSEPIRFMVNGTIHFRGSDAAGNVSEVASYTVSNIDKVAPDKPIAMADITTPTNTSVHVSAIFNEKSVVKEYSLNGTDWVTYTESIELTDNGMIYFRSKDAVGNVSEVTTYEVTNIDKVAPDKPTAVADVTSATNGDVLVTATFSNDSAKKEYSLDGQTWKSYTDAVKFMDNGSVFFRGTDEAGNVSAVTDYVVSNIDKNPPIITLEGDTTSSLKTSTLTANTEAGVDIFWSTDNSNWTKYEGVIVVTANATYYFQATDAAGNIGTNFLTFDNIIQTPISDVAPQTQTWEKNEDAAKYVVEYSVDNFEHVIQVTVDSNSLDSFQMPANYQMRVKAEGGEWSMIEPADATEASTEPKFVKSNEDGNADVFFANSIGTWEAGYVAQHVGSTEDTWGGTKEYATLFGKNKLADIIEGSTDANILLMTDDANGDGLFVDDIYSALPGSVSEQQSRIAQIDEIRAGAGNDIVDMTSQRFAYTGSGLTIRGGDGNDTIWANKGDNFLFGDAGNDRIVGASGNDVIAGGIGNDRMHGGGGNDVFTFCDNWGTDTVEQLEGGSVLLWFASGHEANWNAETLTYTDGENSVKISGVAVDKISLKFGKGDSDQFDKLSSIGAFLDTTSERIFEEEGKGMLASL